MQDQGHQNEDQGQEEQRRAWKALKLTNVEKLDPLASEEEIIVWLDVFVAKLQMANIQGDQLIKSMFQAHLPPNMALWASNYGQQWTWAQMRDHFIKEFAPTRGSEVAREEAWDNLKQGPNESVPEYARRFRVLLRRVLNHVPTEEEENAKFTRFFKGLRHEYREFLAGRVAGHSVADALVTIRDREAYCPIPTSAVTGKKLRFAIDEFGGAAAHDEEGLDSAPIIQAISALQDSVSKTLKRSEQAEAKAESISQQNREILKRLERQQRGGGEAKASEIGGRRTRSVGDRSNVRCGRYIHLPNNNAIKLKCRLYHHPSDCRATPALCGNLVMKRGIAIECQENHAPQDCPYIPAASLAHQQGAGNRGTADIAEQVADRLVGQLRGMMMHQAPNPAIATTTYGQPAGQMLLGAGTSQTQSPLLFFSAGSMSVGQGNEQENLHH